MLFTGCLAHGVHSVTAPNTNDEHRIPTAFDRGQTQRTATADRQNEATASDEHFDVPRKIG
jgi:hypothetical protein